MNSVIVIIHDVIILFGARTIERTIQSNYFSQRSSDRSVLMTTSLKLIAISRVNSVIVIIVSHDLISTGDPRVTFPCPDPGNPLQTQTSDLNLGRDVSLPDSAGEESSGEVRARRPRK